MSSSIKKNFGYNLILTLCGYIFPLITYPYISRVLGVQNIGICNFVDSIINYFVLFSMLGIGSYGVREIARVKNQEERKNIVFSNLISFNIATTILAIILLLVCTITIPKFTEYRPFLLVGVAKLFFNVFLIEWFYQGIQNFRFITIRSLIVRIIYVVSIFLFIKAPEDTLLYFILTTGITIVNALINWFYSKHFVKLSFRKLDWHLFFIPIMTFGYYRVLTSMYTTFNTVFLGFTSGDIEVGYFATATKLYTIIMSVLSAFTTVMVPKVSELMHEGQTVKLQWIADQTLSVISAISLPIIIYSQFCSAEIIHVIAGPGYAGAIKPFRIVILMLLIIGAEQILIQQFLMASTKNKPIFIVSTCGAVVGIGLNLLLTPALASVGAAIAWGASEFIVLIAGMIYVRRNLGISVSIGSFVSDILWSLLYIIPLYGVNLLHFNLWMNLFVSGIVLFLVFVTINLWLHKNLQLVGIFTDVKSKIIHRK